MTTSGTTSNNGSEEGRHHRHATIDSIIIGQGRNRAWSMEGTRGGAAVNVNEFTPLVPSFSFPKNNQQQQLLLLPHQPPSSSSQIIDNTTIVDTTTAIAAPITLNNAKAKKNQTKKGDSEFSSCLHSVFGDTLLFIFFNSSCSFIKYYSYALSNRFYLYNHLFNSQFYHVPTMSLLLYSRNICT